MNINSLANRSEEMKTKKKLMVKPVDCFKGKDYPVSVSHFLHKFTLIELLVVIAIIAILLTSESIFFMSVYVNGVLGKA